MNDTHYNVPPSKASRRVVIQGLDMTRMAGETTYFSGSIGLSSTARDYLHFEQMLANGGRTLWSSSAWSAFRRDDDQQPRGRPVRRLLERRGIEGWASAIPSRLFSIRLRRTAGAVRGAFGWGGAFGTLSWTDPAEKLTGVIMLQQPYGPAQYDFENAVRQAIID